jgi:TetR/AcrR family transcriptional repressor of nem operon
MVRPREFDRDEALDRAMRVFWAKGYAATSTDDLLAAMNIGRQSLYNAFGDKRRLYLEAIERYQQQSVSRHIERLEGPASSVEGIEALLLGLIPAKSEDRGRGCMGVNAIGEFGPDDPDLVALREKAGAMLRKHVLARVRAGQVAGEMDAGMDATEVAAFVLMTMQGIQLNGRAGADSKTLRALAKFTVARLKKH